MQVPIWKRGIEILYIHCKEQIERVDTSKICANRTKNIPVGGKAVLKCTRNLTCSKDMYENIPGSINDDFLEILLREGFKLTKRIECTNSSSKFERASVFVVLNKFF